MVISFVLVAIQLLGYQVLCCVETFPDQIKTNTVCTNQTRACTESCVHNQLYYDGNSTKTYECIDDDIWSPPVPGNGCLDRTPATFWMRFDVEYKTTEIALYCLDAHRKALEDNLTLWCAALVHPSINKTSASVNSDISSCPELHVLVVDSNGDDYCVIDTPVLGVESFTYTANISQDVTLYCELLFGTQVTGLYWQQDNKNLTAASFSDKYRSATKEMPSLTIRNVTYADAGTYSCHAVNYVGTGRSPDTQLNVIARVEDVCNPNSNTACNQKPNGVCYPNIDAVCNPHPSTVCNPNPNSLCNPDINAVCNHNPNVCLPNGVFNSKQNGECNPISNTTCNPNPNGVFNPNPNAVCNLNTNCVCNPNLMLSGSTNPTAVCSPYHNAVCNPNPNAVCNPNPYGVCNLSLIVNPYSDDVCNLNSHGDCNYNPNDVCSPNRNAVCNSNPNGVCNPNPYTACHSNLNSVCNPNPNGVCNPNAKDVCNSKQNGVCNPNPNTVCNPNPNVVFNSKQNGVCNPNPNTACHPNLNSVSNLNPNGVCNPHAQLCICLAF
ncbi:unnamed protein product [Mytilus edulis]|uniref:Ig-like domain-containing protein n=1 Tax=Mytilus edulis TaxID=6550 RepID=A0A8S3T827_MYTED|nr:unnamed protein product [Mytilus edulis]